MSRGGRGEQLHGGRIPTGVGEASSNATKLGVGRGGSQARAGQPHSGMDARAGEDPKVRSGLASVKVRGQTLFYLTTRWLDLYLLDIWRHGIEAT